MKCPQCGSEYGIIHGIKGCLKCNEFANIIEPQYQQRLDKVLSKFKQRDEFYWDLRIERDTYVYYEQDNKVFKLNDYKEISLDTVESLIKDMEVE